MAITRHGQRWMLSGGTVVTPREVITPGLVMIQDNRIAWVGHQEEARAAGLLPEAAGTETGDDLRSAPVLPASDLPPQPDTVVDTTGKIVVPGFIDLHVHGGGGADVMDGTREALVQVSRTHAAGGTTSFVATTVTAPQAELVRAARNVGAAIGADLGGAQLVGLHFEGPYISPAQLGAHSAEHRVDPIDDDFAPLVEAAPPRTRLTAAPELPGALELARTLADRGWHLAMGHTSAMGDEIIRAIDAGFRHVTHLYSCSSGLQVRGGYKTLGVNESALLFDELTVELIADGHHLPGALVELVFKVKGASRTCLVTDAMRATGMGPGRYRLGNVEVLVEHGIAKLPDRSRFAGSVATMAQVVRNAVTQANIGLADAVRMATLTPATLLGIDHRKGSLAAGNDADLVVLTPAFEVARTIVGGRQVYAAPGEAQESKEAVHR